MARFLSLGFAAAVLLGALLVLPAISVAEAQTEPADVLVTELKSLIDSAERSRAADPRFIEDLRGAVARYQTSAITEIFSDDFRDGDISGNPRWMVIEGEFSIDRNHGLRAGGADQTGAGETSDIRAKRAHLAELIALREEKGPYITVRSVTLSGSPQVRLFAEIERLEKLLSAQETNPLEARVAELEGIEADTGRWTQVTSTTLGGNRKAPVGDELARVRAAWVEEEAKLNTPQRSELLIARDIPNAFTLEINVSSAVRDGRLDVDVFQGARLRAGYRLSYNPGGSPDFVLARFGSYGVRRIGAFASMVNLEDGALHKVVLSRTPDATMTLTVDGKKLIGVVDHGFRDPFDGLTLAHESGDFTIRDIAVRGVNR